IALRFWLLAIGSSLKPMAVVPVPLVHWSSRDPSTPPAAAGLAQDDALLGSRLADLLLQPLAGVAHALVLVRVGRTQAAHFGGNLADLLPVGAGDGQARLLRVHRDLDAGRQRVLDGMRVAEREHHGLLALHLGAVADADDFQLARPASGD